MKTVCAWQLRTESVKTPRKRLNRGCEPTQRSVVAGGILHVRGVEPVRSGLGPPFLSALRFLRRRGLLTLAVRLVKG